MGMGETSRPEQENARLHISDMFERIVKINLTDLRFSIIKKV